MSKPTYEDLEQKVRELEKEVVARKKADIELQKSEERFRQLFENISSGVAVYEVINHGEDFIFKDFNKTGERIENTNKNDVIGKSVTEKFPGVKDFGLFEVFQRVWQTGEPESYPISLYKDDRIEGWRENYVYKLKTGEIVAVYNDVTERKKAEEALRESEERFRIIVENMPVMLDVFDNKGNIILWNRECERVSGFISKSFFSFFVNRISRRRGATPNE